jgi:hypothetical protein
LIWINRQPPRAEYLTYAGGWSVAQTTKHHADQVQATVAHGSAATSAVVASLRRSSNFHRRPGAHELPGDLAGGFYVGVAREYLNSRHDAFGEFKKLSLPFRCRPARTII